ncbi:MAG: hypothetical protein NTZ65_04260 [Candidatus Berkelbacteria bacterium]|nr:hypothetical protein [Candidatus Berkelbacteria bacterium]
MTKKVIGAPTQNQSLFSLLDLGSGGSPQQTAIPADQNRLRWIIRYQGLQTVFQTKLTPTGLLAKARFKLSRKKADLTDPQAKAYLKPVGLTFENTLRIAQILALSPKKVNNSAYAKCRSPHFSVLIIMLKHGLRGEM